MTEERWRRIREIYDAIDDKEGPDRQALLDRECGDDRELRREIERLLAAREKAPEWLSAPVLGSAAELAQLVANPVPGMEGRILGGYQLVREIGRGGMGSVYLAERVDGAYHKQVAVKLVSPGHNSAEVLERFRMEREILASLEHPHIARLIDGGSTEEGLPYFVMEYIDGQPIHRWADDRKLDVSQRLELFRQVCAAVEYAHQNLVVHRDLKPGNIFVTKDGQVKLLDFGIAKILETGAGSDGSATATLMQLMTPDYASPEQIKGERITTRTDVYALGVVLYELLTGHRPYHVLSAALHEIARVIAEVEPTRPSEAVDKPDPDRGPDTGEGLRKRLRGDLDSILLTALRKEPERRYGSVTALDEDLRRHLERLPVSARPDGLAYRASRFVQRNPAGVMAGVFIAVSVAGGMMTTVWASRAMLGGVNRGTASRDILGPQITQFAYLSLAGAAAVFYFIRATSRRIWGAVAGGCIMAATIVAKRNVDFAMGWWHTRLTGANVFPALVQLELLVMLLAISPAYLLLCWRVSRRFGWKGGAILTILLGLAAVRERIWADTIMQVVSISWSPKALLTDILFYVGAALLGQAAMRMIAGPAKSDPLARTRVTRKTSAA